MKNVMKLFLISVMIFGSLQSFAQFKIGAKAGVLFANAAFNWDESDYQPETKMKLGWMIGPMIEYSFTENLALQSGLFLAAKGYSDKLEEETTEMLGATIVNTYDGFARTSLNYLEIPITVAYKINDLQIYAGPYLAYCLGGKVKEDFTVTQKTTFMGQTITETTDIKEDWKIKSFMGPVKEGDLDEDEDAVKALDYGLNFGIGYQVGPVLINAGYSFGMGNLTPDIDVDGYDYDPKDFKASNRVISLTAAFLFGGK